MKTTVTLDNGMPFYSGEEVYVITGPNQYIKCMIRGLLCIVMNIGKEPKAFPQKAMVNRVIFLEKRYFPNHYYYNEEENVYYYREDPSHIPLDLIFKTEEEAKEESLLHRVEIGKKQWLEVIGDRDIPDKLENCELMPCCANISDIRDLLIICKINGGLIKKDVKRLQWLVDQHEKPSSTPVLNKILKQLKIRWKGDNNGN